MRIVKTRVYGLYDKEEIYSFMQDLYSKSCLFYTAASYKRQKKYTGSEDHVMSSSTYPWIRSFYFDKLDYIACSILDSLLFLNCSNTATISHKVIKKNVSSPHNLSFGEMSNIIG